MRDFVDYESMAMLELTEQERVFLRERFEMLTDSFSALDSFDTDGVEPLVTVMDINNIMRNDTAVKCITRDEVLRNAPESKDGYFQVPAAID